MTFQQFRDKYGNLVGGVIVALSIGLFVFGSFYANYVEDERLKAEQEALTGSSQVFYVEDYNLNIIIDRANKNVCYAGVHASRFDCVHVPEMEIP